MAITDWPEYEKPREKLLLKGAAALSNAELLAVMLRNGIKGQSAVDLARHSLNMFGGLRRFLELDLTEFCTIPGLGMTKFVQLQAAVELMRRYLQESLPKNAIISKPDEVKRLIMAKLRHHQQEVFACLYLDSQHRIIQFMEMFHGTIDCATIHPREIVKCCLRLNATAVILAHNHPSGKADPSQADIEVTQQLKEALALVDVRLLDHFIVGDTRVTSFVDRGLL